MKNKTEQIIIKNIIHGVNKYLKSIEDDMKQFSAYLYLIVWTKYYTELSLCHESQDFNYDNKHLLILNEIADDLYVQETKKINKDVKEFRARPDYDKVMREIETKWI